MKRPSVVSFGIVLVSLIAVPVQPEVRPVVGNPIAGRMSQAALRRALKGAARKLATPKCARVLSDFSDASGRPLQESLDPQQTAAGYLGLILFADGQPGPACTRSTTLAFTHPGSRVVYLCQRFSRPFGLSDGYRENVLIHETLHSLGLQENPPSSDEITRQVEKRCGA